jgi:hypothetical protein
MTDTRPAILETVTERSRTLSETLRELRAFKTTVEEYQDRVDNMSTNERELFYQSTTSIQTDVIETSDPETLLETRETLEEAVRSPLQQVARESFTALLGQLQVALSDQERDQALDRLESKIPAELESITETYQNLYTRIDDFDTVLLGLLGEVVEERPSIMLSPEHEFTPIVDRLEARHETLKELETILAESDWAPTLEFADAKQFYDRDAGDIDLSAVRSDVDAIATALTTLRENGIEIQLVLEEELTDAYESGNIDEFVDTLENARQTVAATADTHTTVVEFMDPLEADAQSPERFESVLADLRASYETLQTHDYSTLEYTAQSVEDMTNDIDRFIELLHGSLQAQRELVDELDLAANASASRPEPRFEESPLLPSHVRDRPTEALEEYADRHEWLTSHLETDVESVDQEQVLEIWQSLTGGEEVPLTPDNQDTVLALADRLPVSVVLSNSQRSA